MRVKKGILRGIRKKAQEKKFKDVRCEAETAAECFADDVAYATVCHTSVKDWYFDLTEEEQEEVLAGAVGAFERALRSELRDFDNQHFAEVMEML